MALREYFSERFPAAFSLSTTGGAVGMGVFPILAGVLTEVYGWRGSLLIIAGINVHLFVVAMLTRTPGVRVRSTMSASPSCRSVAEEEYEGDVDQLLNPSHHRNDARHDQTICKRIKGCIDSCLDRISISVIFREYPMLKSIPFLSFSSGIMATGMVVFLVPSAIEKGIDLERASVLSSLFGIGILTGRLSSGLVITKTSWKPSTIVCCFYPLCATSFIVHATCTRLHRSRGQFLHQRRVSERHCHNSLPPDRANLAQEAVQRRLLSLRFLPRHGFAHRRTSGW